MDIQMNNYLTKTIANDILNNIEQLNDNIKQLNNMIDNVNEAWKSETATEYITIMKEKNIPEIQKLCDTLEKYGNFLRNVPAAYGLLDEIFSTKSVEF